MSLLRSAFLPASSRTSLSHEMPTIREVLPPVYRDLLPAVFDRPVPEEVRATCDDCAMCGDVRPHENVSFLPSTKCCTFHPQLPNYLVGALFEDPSPELEPGRQRMRARIASRSRVTPRWVAPSRKVRAIYRSARHEAFGRSETLLCPYYDEGQCTVWRYRESYCSTFFCKHDAGDDGRELWREIRRFLDDVERSLARHFAAKLAPELTEPRPHMTLEELEDQPPHPDDYAAWWGDWQGREEELYRACAGELAKMGPAELDAVLLVDAKRRLPLVEGRYQTRMSSALPEALVLAAHARGEPIAGSDDVRVTGYSELDPLVLSKPVFDVVSGITEATPSSRVLSELDGDEELLLELKRWRVLVVPDINHSE